MPTSLNAAARLRAGESDAEIRTKVRSIFTNLTSGVKLRNKESRNRKELGHLVYYSLVGWLPLDFDFSGVKAKLKTLKVSKPKKTELGKGLTYLLPLTSSPSGPVIEIVTKTNGVSALVIVTYRSTPSTPMDNPNTDHPYNQD